MSIHRAFLIVIGVTAVVTAAGATTLHSPSGHGGHHGHHQIRDVSTETPVPVIELSVDPDPMGGWNLHVDVQHFRFAPARVNGPHRPGEGHAHLYVDGHKVARLYGPWFHLPSPGQGSHQLRVTLNANSHEELAIGDEPIAATIVVGVSTTDGS